MKVLSSFSILTLSVFLCFFSLATANGNDLNSRLGLRSFQQPDCRSDGFYYNENNERVGSCVSNQRDFTGPDLSQMDCDDLIGLADQSSSYTQVDSSLKDAMSNKCGNSCTAIGSNWSWSWSVFNRNQRGCHRSDGKWVSKSMIQSAASCRRGEGKDEFEGSFSGNYYVDCGMGDDPPPPSGQNEYTSDNAKKGKKVATVVKEPFSQNQELVDALKSCEGEKESVVQEVCNPESKEVRKVASYLDKQISGPLGQVASIAAACSKVSDTLIQAQNATAAFKTACTAGMSLCKNTCDGVKELVRSKVEYCSQAPEGCDQLSQVERQKNPKCNGDWFCNDNTYGTLSSLESVLSDVKDHQKVCQSQEFTVDKLAEQLAIYAKNREVAEVCKNRVAAKAENDNGGIDCSDAANASLLTCVCQNNPSDPACPTTSSKPGGPNSGLVNNNPGPASGVPKGLSAADIEDDMKKLGDVGNSRFAGLPEGNGQGKSAATKGFGKGGGSAAPGGGGSGSSRFASSSGSGRSFSSPGKNVVSGFIGGGRRGGGSSYGSFSKGQGVSTGNGSSVRGKAKSRFDLKKFLPGSQAMRRRIAGVTGKDGITGPNGMGLFEKVSFRIKKEKSRLLP